MFAKPLPLNRQVEDYVRNRIVSGEFAPGSRLPSTQALADLTGTSLFTVQTALTRLAGEGLLDRRAKRATYVKGDKPALTCAGLYYNRPFARDDAAFYQVLGKEISRKLNEEGVEVRIWSDERNEQELTGPLPALKQAMDKREIQALIAPLVCKNDLDWLLTAPIPTAINTNNPSVKQGVDASSLKMLRQGMEELKNQGCRTVGLINNLMMRADPEHQWEVEYYQYLVEVTKELGLEIRNEWIRFPAQYTSHLASFGHQQFHALWDLKQRPDGLMVHSDATATGVVSAILERQVRVPDELKLVLHANDLLPYPCPLPVSFLMMDVGRYADALIKIIRRQLAGEAVSPIQISVSVVRGDNAFRLVDIPGANLSHILSPNP